MNRAILTLVARELLAIYLRLPAFVVVPDPRLRHFARVTPETNP
jgi:hypothetical protein